MDKAHVVLPKCYKLLKVRQDTGFGRFLW